jgi:hypothetical protein
MGVSNEDRTAKIASVPWSDPHLAFRRSGIGPARSTHRLRSGRTAISSAAPEKFSASVGSRIPESSSPVMLKARRLSVGTPPGSRMASAASRAAVLGVPVESDLS